MRGIIGIIWLLCIGGATIFALQAQSVWGDHPLLITVLILLWLVTAIGLLRLPQLNRLRQVAAAPVHALRRAPALYWFVIIAYIAFMLGWWTVGFQPTNGRYLTPFEFAYLLIALWGLLYLLNFDGSHDEAHMMGGKLAKNPLTGVLITLTTVFLFLVGAESYLRLFYITTDAYTFTSMNYHWYQNFYYPSFNTLGYRDHEPIPNAPRRIAVVGDSFTVGQGINNIDDTFPQLIELGLNDGTDVNVIAQTGWDTDVEEFNLNLYPYKPDTVILSYYLNDIDYILQQNEQDPNDNFSFPEPGFGSWFVLNFFVPNYVYYNLAQITSSERNSNFLGDLIDAHLDSEIWARQVMQLDSFVAWTQNNDARLIVLIWANPVAIDASAPAVEQVAGYFRERSIEVVDMSDSMRTYPPTSLIVNNFDTHPSVLAHRLAAEALLAVINSD